MGQRSNGVRERRSSRAGVPRGRSTSSSSLCRARDAIPRKKCCWSSNSGSGVRAAKTAPVPRSRLLSNSDTCGPEAQVSHPLPDVQLNVVYWCKGEVFLPNGTWDKAHIQVKLRPRIINNSAHSITIGIGKPATIRLLVKSAQLPSGWDPPPNTASGGDKPVLVTWDGEQLWAVPPNVNGDATAAANGYYTGFATKWQATSLVSGGSYFNPLTYDANRQPDRNGDLVFQLPLDSRGRVEIVGLAVVTPSPSPTVLAVAQQIDWPASSEPSSF